MRFIDRLLGRSAAPKRARAQYLRDNSSGILTMRRAVTRDGASAVRESAERASALAWDFIRNSGWIAGAVDQIITDTIGDELKLSARPKLARLGWSAEEITAWCRLVEEEWYLHVWSAREYSLDGSSTLAENLDGVMRFNMASGEAFGVIDFMPLRMRKRHGVLSGTKVSLIAPHRVKRETDEYNNLDQGIFLDPELRRPVQYRTVTRKSGQDVDLDIPAWNGPLRRVVHVMDRGENPDSVRGISLLAPVAKVIAQYLCNGCDVPRRLLKFNQLKGAHGALFVELRQPVSNNEINHLTTVRKTSRLLRATFTRQGT